MKKAFYELAELVTILYCLGHITLYIIIRPTIVGSILVSLFQALFRQGYRGSVSPQRYLQNIMLGKFGGNHLVRYDNNNWDLNKIEIA